MDSHEEAVRAATRRYRRTEAAHEQSRAEVIGAVIAALRSGERPTDVTDWSPFTATYVRNFAREAGVMPADSPGPRYHLEEFGWLRSQHPEAVKAVTAIAVLDVGLADEDYVGGVIGYALAHGKNGRDEIIRAITDRLVRWATREGRGAWARKYDTTTSLALDIAAILGRYLPVAD